MIESTISSPSRCSRPKVAATRLIASVALRVKMTSPRSNALRNFADDLARLLVSVGRGVGEIMQAAMHVGIFVGIGVLMRSSTAFGFCADAALSR
jgi:hypothetical protein